MTWLYLVGYLLIGIICAVGIVVQSYRKDAPLFEDDAMAVIGIVLLWPIVLLAVSMMVFGTRIIRIGEKIYFLWRKRK
jgi:hypothetical protein